MPSCDGNKKEDAAQWSHPLLTVLGIAFGSEFVTFTRGVRIFLHGFVPSPLGGEG